jgi:hypothetical protein
MRQRGVECEEALGAAVCDSSRERNLRPRGTCVRHDPRPAVTGSIMQMNAMHNLAYNRTSGHVDSAVEAAVHKAPWQSLYSVSAVVSLPRRERAFAKVCTAT